MMVILPCRLKICGKKGREMIEEEETPIPIKKNKCNVFWVKTKSGEERWACKNQLSSNTFSLEKTQCWLGSCPGRIGKKFEDMAVVKPKESKICNYYDCNEPIASNRKRYCSDKCRLRKARADYETRNPNRKKKKK